jgi:hypothetical protein
MRNIYRPVKYKGVDINHQIQTDKGVTKHLYMLPNGAYSSSNKKIALMEYAEKTVNRLYNKHNSVETIGSIDDSYYIFICK